MPGLDYSFYCHENFLWHKRFCFAEPAEKDMTEIFLKTFSNMNNFFNQLLDSKHSKPNFLKHFSQVVQLALWLHCTEYIEDFL